MNHDCKEEEFIKNGHKAREVISRVKPGCQFLINEIPKWWIEHGIAKKLRKQIKTDKPDAKFVRSKYKDLQTEPIEGK